MFVFYWLCGCRSLFFFLLFVPLSLDRFAFFSFIFFSSFYFIQFCLRAHHPPPPPPAVFLAQSPEFSCPVYTVPVCLVAHPPVCFDQRVSRPRLKIFLIPDPPSLPVLVSNTFFFFFLCFDPAPLMCIFFAMMSWSGTVSHQLSRPGCPARLLSH